MIISKQELNHKKNKKGKTRIRRKNVQDNRYEEAVINNKRN